MMSNFRRLILNLVLLFFYSCSNFSTPLNNNREISSTSDKNCFTLSKEILSDSTSAKAVKSSETELSEFSEILEDYYHNQFADFRKLFFFQMPESTKLGEWSFRSKSSSSIASKLARKAKAGEQIFNIDSAKDEIGDGLGARILFSRNNSEPDNLKNKLVVFVDEFSDLLNKGEVKLLSIENYRSDEMPPYFSDDQVQKILEAARRSGQNPEIKNDQTAIRQSGYTSVHINVLLKNGVKAEIQVRDPLIDQMGEISHVFYDFVSKKTPSFKVSSDPRLARALQVFESMTPSEIDAYNKYLENSFELVTDYISDGSVTRVSPILPENLASKKEIRVDSIAEAFGFLRIRDFFRNPTVFKEKSIYQNFNSADFLADNYPTDVVKKVIGNVSQGDSAVYQALKINPERRKIEKELTGLNYVAVIPWEESAYLKKRRGIIRANRKDPSKPKFKGKINLPKYLDGQYTGEGTAKIKDIHYMQDSADHNSGVYTVIGNAKSIKDGTLKVQDLPPLTVWRDVSGKIWSLDHRRLAAFELSGVVDEVPVRFATKEEVVGDFYKFSNADEGRSIIIQINDSPIAYIIAKP